MINHFKASKYNTIFISIYEAGFYVLDNYIVTIYIFIYYKP